MLTSGVFRISKGGSNIRWPLVLTQRGGQTKFSNLFTMTKKNFWPRGKYATDANSKLKVFYY